MAYDISFDLTQDITIHSKIVANTVVVPTFIITMTPADGSTPTTQSGSTVVLLANSVTSGAVITITGNAQGFGSGDFANLISTFQSNGNVTLRDVMGATVSEVREAFSVSVKSADVVVN